MARQPESGHGGSAHRLVILASGSGSNAQAVIDACLSGVIHADVVGVVSNRDDAGVLRRADDHQIERAVLTPHPGENRSGYDARLADLVARFRPDHVLLLGWMRILSKVFLDRFAGSVINLHPALPGELPGTDAIRRAFVEARSGSRSSTGVMLHLVPDEQVDAGPVLAHAVVPILPDDSLETLSARIHDAEHRLVVSMLSTRCTTKEIPV
jgi:phosphoribosylglycinamide formyltransferase-1